jgi:predicted transcriptional regulator of viral defense system
MKAINTLHEALLNRGKIFKKEEILRIFEEYKKLKSNSNHKNIIEYLSKHNYIKRIFLGYYYINSYDEKERGFCNYSDRELIFSILNKEKVKWYLGLNTAIYEQGKTWQTPNMINVINTRISGRRKIVGLNVKFIKIKEDLFFGLKELKTNNKVPYFYSDPAKTYIDMVYFKQSKILKRVKNTQTYLKRYPKWVGKR